MYKTSSRTNLKYEDVVQHDDITVRESRISPIFIVIESKRRFSKDFIELSKSRTLPQQKPSRHSLCLTSALCSKTQA